MKKNIVIILALLCSFLPTCTHAAEMAYSVHADIPENQVDKSLTYFDLQTSPGATQSISVDIINSSDKNQTFQVDLNNAYTNVNGVIDYSNNKVKKEVPKSVQMSDLVKERKQEVTLPPHETKTVTFTANMPKEILTGTVLGGIKVAQKDEPKNDSDSKMTIDNHYAYIIGVKLRESLTDVEPKMSLLDVKPGLANHHTAITATLQNSSPTILKQMSLNATIKKEGSDEAITTLKKENVGFAPSTNMDLAIPLNDKEVKPGKYVATISIKTSDGKHKWNLTKEFSVSDTKAKDVNKKAVSVKKQSQHSYFTVTTLSILILVLIMIVLLYKLRRKK